MDSKIPIQASDDALELAARSQISAELFSRLVSVADSHELTRTLIAAIDELISPDVTAVVRITYQTSEVLVLASSVEGATPVLSSDAVYEYLSRVSVSGEPFVFQSKSVLGELVNAGSEALDLRGGIATSLGIELDNEVVLICLWSDTTAMAYVDVPLLQSICSTASHIYEQKRIFQEQKTIASTLQRGLLKVDYIDGKCEVATRYIPAFRELDVGGDWYDAVNLDDDHVGLIVGDVVGKGLVASATMSQLRSALSAIAMVNDSPAEVFRRLDRFATRIEGATAATAVYAKVDLSSGLVKFCSAGHPPPIVIRANGNREILDEAQNWPIAVQTEKLREVCKVKLEIGDTLLMYTDGLVETRGDVIDVGIKKVGDKASTLRKEPLEMFCDELLDGVVADKSRNDDVVLAAFRMLEEPIARFHIEREPFDLVLADIRNEFDEWLQSVGVDEVARDDLRLACGEAVSNCLEHSGITETGGLVTIHATKDKKSVFLSVSDTGKWDSSPLTPGRGRGVEFMNVVTDHMFIDSSTTGTVIRMTKKL